MVQRRGATFRMRSESITIIWVVPISPVRRYCGLMARFAFSHINMRTTATQMTPVAGNGSRATIAANNSRSIFLIDFAAEGNGALSCPVTCREGGYANSERASQSYSVRKSVDPITLSAGTPTVSPSDGAALKISAEDEMQRFSSHLAIFFLYTGRKIVKIVPPTQFGFARRVSLRLYFAETSGSCSLLSFARFYRGNRSLE